MKWWPFQFVRKDEYRLLRLENATLRSDLRNAVIELRKHRLLIASLSTGEAEVTEAIERARLT
jgi:hypothetical protein